MKNRSYFFYSLFIYTTLITFTFSRCSDSNDAEKTNGNLEELRLTDFPLTEITYTDIEIIHPEIVNGEQVDPGHITIVIPRSYNSLVLSLKQFGHDKGKYTITPLPGELQNFTEEPVTYTVSFSAFPDRKVQYEVSIAYSDEPWTENKTITGFRFEKSKNPDLPQTIEAVKIADYESSSDGAIYILVPDGTDFSKLVPTITFDAAKLYYKTNVDFTEFENGITVDFKYPNQFFLQAENSLGEKSMLYTVIVDVRDPVVFDEPVIVTTPVKTGDGSTSTSFLAFSTWTNRGNHPITGMAPKEYIEKTYPFSGSDINIITTSLANPQGGTPGVLPGEKGQVHITVKQVSITGQYSTKAVFKPTFSFNINTISYWPPDDRIEDIFAEASVTIQSTLEE
ncbi:MAG TPA: hypothetical protein VGK59_22425 [Ohtaekwangia sp.]